MLRQPPTSKQQRRRSRAMHDRLEETKRTSQEEEEEEATTKRDEERQCTKASIEAVGPHWVQVQRLVSAEDGQSLYNELVPYVREEPIRTLTMYGKPQPERNRSAFFSRSGESRLTYSGTTLPSNGWPAGLERLCRLATELTGETFDAAGMVWYENETHRLGFHRDRDSMDSTVCSFSFGYEQRRFQIREEAEAKASRSTRRRRRPCWVQMPSASAIVMLPGMQAYRKHAVMAEPAPKGTLRCEPRLNVTLRHRQPGTRCSTGELLVRKARVLACIRAYTRNHPTADPLYDSDETEIERRMAATMAQRRRARSTPPPITQP